MVRNVDATLAWEARSEVEVQVFDGASSGFQQLQTLWRSGVVVAAELRLLIPLQQAGGTAPPRGPVTYGMHA